MEPGFVKFFDEFQTFEMTKDDVARLRKIRKSIAMRVKKPFYSIKGQATFVQHNIQMFFKKWPADFDLWWNDDLKQCISDDVELHYLYHTLFAKYRKYKDHWFDMESFNWTTSSHIFIQHNNFNEVTKYWNNIEWNEESVDAVISSFGRRHFKELWEKLSDRQKNIARKDCVCSLTMYCRDDFKTWFDKELVSINDYVQDLSHYARDNFEDWWDSTKIENSEIHDCTRQFCSDNSKHFTKWFSKETFDYKNCTEYLILKYPEHYDLWYDESKIHFSRRIKYCKYDMRELIKDQRGSSELHSRHFMQIKDLLFLTLNDKFRLWYKKKYFRPRDEMFILLKHYAMDHQDMWNEQYILHQLKK